MLRLVGKNDSLSIESTGISTLQPRSTYDKSYVRSLFDSIARRYDLLNHLLSSGFDIFWRAKAIQLLADFHPKRILDIATGTADLALKAAELRPEQIIGIDISEEMLKLGRRKISQRNLDRLITLQAGDAESLGFPDDSFDATTVAFGVRNYSNLMQGLQEMCRVLRPDGVAIILEFSQPKVFPVKQLYALYSRWVLPSIGGFISGHRGAYEYLPQTVREFPDGEGLLLMLRAAGFKSTKQHRLTFGIATIYIATK